VTKRLTLGSCIFHYNVAQCRNSLPAKFDYEIRRSPLDTGAQTGVVFDRVLDAISRKQCEIELR